MFKENITPDISELSDYSAWYGQNPRELIRYASSKLSPDLAIAVTRLFWPDFVIHENRVFLAFRFEDQNFKHWEDEFDGDLQAVERMINHVHVVADLLTYPFENLSYPNIEYFGRILVQTWKAALKTQFPDRAFQISGEKDGELDDFVITFWQTQPQPA